MLNTSCPKLFLSFVLTLLLCATMMAQRGATLRGQITDELGGAILTASVTLTDRDGVQQATQTDDRGAYSFSNLKPGVYRLQVTSHGFANLDQSNVEVLIGQTKILDLKLRVAAVEERVTVDTQNSLDPDPDSNRSARVIRGSELNALSDDPEELAAQLNALAGPAAGPNGAQIYVDGFTANQGLPDKQLIREIVINQNPFSAEQERFGFGSIQIFTRPGGGSFHGSASFTFSDAILNSRNPFALNRPPYQRRYLDASLNGPLSKQASFFLFFARRDVGDTGVINATVLDDGLNVRTLNRAFPSPRSFMSFNPRLDYQLSKANTLSARYRYDWSSLRNLGVGGFSLASRANDQAYQAHNIQLIGTSVFSQRAVNEAALQYFWEGVSNTATDPGTGLIVLDAFTGGGSQIGKSSFKRREGEFRDYMTLTARHHTLKLGGRLRWAHIEDIAPVNFGGTYTFSGSKSPQLDAANRIVFGPDGQPVLIEISSLERYRRTVQFQRLGFSPAQVRTLGGGPAQLTVAAGNPVATVKQWDLAAFIQDDWKLRPGLTLSWGLRYQTQTNINSARLFAPRASFAWTPWVNKSGQPGTVIRGGAGIFYDLIRTNLSLQAKRYDGINQTLFIVTDPLLLDSFPAIPASSALASRAQPATIWRKASDLTEPYYLQASVSVEHSLPRNTMLTISYVETHGLHQLRARNINAPLPGISIRPSGSPNNVYQYETSGIFKQHLLVVNASLRPNRRVSLNASYTLGKASGDTDGAGTFPADSYDLRREFGPASTDIRHRFNLTGNIETRWGISFNPLLIASTGAPFNITTGTDANGDSLFADRPAFAADLSRPSVRLTPFGAFDLTPVQGAQIIPRNFGRGPRYFSVNLRMAKTFSFGHEKGTAGSQGQNRNKVDGPYKLALSVAASNLFNRTNPGLPVGNLTSPLFGVSNSTSQIGQFTFLGSAGTSNRSITLRAQFNF